VNYSQTRIIATPDICDQMHMVTKNNELKIELERAAVAYANLRCAWALADAEERQEIEPSRTAAHNAFISCCDILARNMRACGEDVRWREEVGNDRKRLGDWACLRAYQLAIQAN
jgi:hypothetical protein